jgi:chromate transporter
MSSISFGGIPSVLPDIQCFVVIDNAWLTDRDFANFFALAQTIPGPNMILMMVLIGWKTEDSGGSPARSRPPAQRRRHQARCISSVIAWGNRFRDASWQKVVRPVLRH